MNTVKNKKVGKEKRACHVLGEEALCSVCPGAQSDLPPRPQADCRGAHLVLCPPERALREARES